MFCLSKEKGLGLAVLKVQWFHIKPKTSFRFWVKTIKVSRRLWFDFHTGRPSTRKAFVCRPRREILVLTATFMGFCYQVELFSARLMGPISMKVSLRAFFLLRHRTFLTTNSRDGLLPKRRFAHRTNFGILNDGGGGREYYHDHLGL